MIFNIMMIDLSAVLQRKADQWRECHYVHLSVVESLTKESKGLEFCIIEAFFHNVMFEAAGQRLCAASVFDNQVNKSILATTKTEIPWDNIRRACAVGPILQRNRCHSVDIDAGKTKPQCHSLDLCDFTETFWL